MEKLVQLQQKAIYIDGMFSLELEKLFASLGQLVCWSINYPSPLPYHAKVA